MPVFNGETVSVPRDLLKALLDHGTFSGDINSSDRTADAADYIIAVSEAGQLLTASEGSKP